MGSGGRAKTAPLRIRLVINFMFGLTLIMMPVATLVRISSISATKPTEDVAPQAARRPPASTFMKTVIRNTWYPNPYSNSSAEGVQSLRREPGPLFPLLHDVTCEFPLNHINESCPRFVKTRFVWNERAGIGDRFFQYIVGLTYALHVGGTLVNADDDLVFESNHGDYSWVLDFFQFNHANANQTLDALQNVYGNLNIIERIEETGDNYETRIATLRQTPCKTLIYVDNDDCFGGRECYFSSEPRIYEHARHIVGCWFLQTDRSRLPALLFDMSWYNVAIHLRVGDVTLMSGEKGQRFFGRLKSQLDVVLKDFRVHYYFFVEVPSDERGIHDDQAAPTDFPFLGDIFRVPPESGRPERVSYIKNMDVKATLYQQMNADMLVTTGSSFPLLAATVSPKPVLLFTRSKEGGFYPTQMRSDYAYVEETGEVLRPTLSELAAHVLIRYLEVHEKSVPYSTVVHPMGVEAT